MTFQPLTLDGQAGAQRLLGFGTYKPLHCLEAVHRAFPFSRSDAPGVYTSARVQWDRTPANRRRYDRTPPAGAIVFWDLYVRSLGYSAGHIAISVGDGRVATTDWPVHGRVGVADIDAVTARWGAVYLGWTDVVGGHNVTTAKPPTPKPARPLPEVTEMAILIRRNTDGLIGLVAPELWAHMPDVPTAEINAAVYSTADEIHDLAPVEFDRVTRSAGIPDHVRAEGVFWSRASEISAALAKLTA